MFAVLLQTFTLYSALNTKAAKKSLTPLPPPLFIFAVSWLFDFTEPRCQLYKLLESRKKEKEKSHLTRLSCGWKTLYGKTLTQKNTVCRGEIWVSGGSGALLGPADTITDTVPPLHSTALTNTLLLFLLFYECCRPEERDRADFPDSDNISNQASKNHFTNHPEGQHKAAGLHSLSHGSCVNLLLKQNLVCTPPSCYKSSRHGLANATGTISCSTLWHATWNKTANCQAQRTL